MTQHDELTQRIARLEQTVRDLTKSHVTLLETLSRKGVLPDEAWRSVAELSTQALNL